MISLGLDVLAVGVRIADEKGAVPKWFVAAAAAAFVCV
jgi:hypothetical protein